MANEQLKERFRALLKQHGLSQNRLAQLTGVSQGAIAAIATGRTTQPEPRTIEALAPAFKMTGSELMIALGLLQSGDETSTSAKMNSPLDMRRALLRQYILENPSIEDILIDIVDESSDIPLSLRELEETFRYAVAIYKERRKMQQQQQQEQQQNNESLG